MLYLLGSETQELKARAIFTNKILEDIVNKLKG
jgi:hypothetical protein